jgi:hypothetical protein
MYKTLLKLPDIAAVIGVVALTSTVPARAGLINEDSFF